MRFDWTISLGQLITALTFLFLGAFAWKDLTWRVKNLEHWRAEHMIDSDSRGKLINEMKEILDHVRWQTSTMLGRKLRPPVETRR